MKFGKVSMRFIKDFIERNPDKYNSISDFSKKIGHHQQTIINLVRDGVKQARFDVLRDVRSEMIKVEKKWSVANFYSAIEKEVKKAS